MPLYTCVSCSRRLLCNNINKNFNFQFPGGGPPNATRPRQWKTPISLERNCWRQCTRKTCTQIVPAEYYQTLNTTTNFHFRFLGVDRKHASRPMMSNGHNVDVAATTGFFSLLTFAVLPLLAHFWETGSRKLLLFFELCDRHFCRGQNLEILIQFLKTFGRSFETEQYFLNPFNTYRTDVGSMSTKNW